MRKINTQRRGIFRNKWGFVDTFYLIYKNLDKITDVKPKNFADSMSAFELKRKQYNRRPEDLIDDKGSLHYDKDMFDYIGAFNRGGSEKNNVRIRHRVFNNYFLTSANFNLK